MSAESSCALYQGTTLQLAEKVVFSIQNPKNVPQGLKPGIDSIGIVPGMNPRPTARLSFSASCLVVPNEPKTGLGFSPRGAIAIEAIHRSAEAGIYQNGNLTACIYLASGKKVPR